MMPSAKPRTGMIPPVMTKINPMISAAEQRGTIIRFVIGEISDVSPKNFMFKGKIQIDVHSNTTKLLRNFQNNESFGKFLDIYGPKTPIPKVAVIERRKPLLYIA